MTLPETKQAIWEKSKHSLVAIQSKADRLRISLPLTNLEDATRLLKSFDRKQRKAPAVPQWVKDRYNAAHREWFKQNRAIAYRDGHYFTPDFPKVHTANGLQRFIVNYFDWTGNYGNRINTTGRKIFDEKKGEEIWIKGSTKKGTGDTSNILNGLAVKLEVKIGKDTPKDKQLLQQKRVRAAGGVYEFVSTPEQVLEIFDKLIKHRNAMSDWLGK